MVEEGGWGWGWDNNNPLHRRKMRRCRCACWRELLHNPRSNAIVRKELSFFNLLLRPVCRWRDTTRTGAHGRTRRRGRESVTFTNECVTSAKRPAWVNTRKICGQCVKGAVGADACGGLPGGWCHLSTADRQGGVSVAAAEPRQGCSLASHPVHAEVTLKDERDADGGEGWREGWRNAAMRKVF